MTESPSAPWSPPALRGVERRNHWPRSLKLEATELSEKQHAARLPKCRQRAPLHRVLIAVSAAEIFVLSAIDLLIY